MNKRIVAVAAVATILLIVPLTFSLGLVGVPRNQNLETFILYLSNGEDIRICYNLPKEGLPLGEMLLSEVYDETTLFCYPYNPSDYQRSETEWLIDHSVFMVGAQNVAILAQRMANRYMGKFHCLTNFEFC